MFFFVIKILCMSSMFLINLISSISIFSIRLLWMIRPCFDIILSSYSRSESDALIISQARSRSLTQLDEMEPGDRGNGGGGSITRRRKLSSAGKVKKTCLLRKLHFLAKTICLVMSVVVWYMFFGE